MFAYRTELSIRNDSQELTSHAIRYAKKTSKENETSKKASVETKVSIVEHLLRG